MMDALVNDSVAFVELLLQRGVSMQKWLSIGRLEELYNAVSVVLCLAFPLFYATLHCSNKAWRWLCYWREKRQCL
jgi:hypothetical protein